MAAVVGGRMEAVAPRRSLYGADYLRLAALAAVSLGVHLWLIGHTVVTARDSVGFARTALAFQSPEAAGDGPLDPHRTVIDVLQDHAHHPQHPGYPAAVFLAGKVVRRVVDLPLADSTLLTTQIVSGLAALLLVVPMYLLGRMLFGRNVGFVGALLFQILPVPARITSDGLSEGLYLLCAVTALYLGARAVRRPGVGGFLACGLAAGATYLVRPEGLMVAGAVGLVVGWLGLTRQWPRDLALGRLTALVVGAALIAGPYMLVIKNFTNKPTPNGILPSFPGRPGFAAEARPAGPVFAMFWVEPGVLGHVGPAVNASLTEAAHGLHFGAAGLAVVGLIALRRRYAADPGLAVPVALLGVNFAVVVLLGFWGHQQGEVRTHYVSERHVLLIVLLGCVFAAAGLRAAARAVTSTPAAGRVVAAVILVGLAASAVPPSLRPMHANREGHKHAGRWLKARFDEHLAAKEPVVLLDPFEWAGCYSEKTLHHIHPDSRDARVRYTVLDNKNHADEHSRLPRIDTAREVLKGGKAVYWWPEGVPVEQVQIVVYKTVGPSVNEAEGKPFGTEK